MRLLLYIRLTSFLLLSISVLATSKLRKRDSQTDFFGVSKIGFQCSQIFYHKNELYAAALKGCKAFLNDRKAFSCGQTLCQSASSIQRDVDFSESRFRYQFNGFPGPFFMYPILRNLLLYSDGLNMSPGPDRIVMNRNCEIVAVITNQGQTRASPKIGHCQSLSTLATPRLSPASSPASSPGLSPGLSPASSPPSSP